MGNKAKHMRKRFEEMDHQELLSAKEDLDGQLKMNDLMIKRESERATSMGQTVKIPYELEQRRQQLGWLSNKVKHQLKRFRPQPVSPATEAENFMRLAQETLEPGLYSHLLTQARTMA